jgi:hypothetical protein
LLLLPRFGLRARLLELFVSTFIHELIAVSGA